MGIVRPIMETHPWAWAYFIFFILVATFTMLNLFIAIIVDAMQSVQANKKEQETADVDELVQDEQQQLRSEIRELKSDIQELKSLLQNR